MSSAMGTSTADVDGVAKSLSLRAPYLFPSVLAGANKLKDPTPFCHQSSWPPHASCDCHCCDPSCGDCCCWLYWPMMSSTDHRPLPRPFCCQPLPPFPLPFCCQPFPPCLPSFSASFICTFPFSLECRVCRGAILLHVPVAIASMTVN